MQTLTLEIKDSAMDKIMYFLNHLKDDVKIINQEAENLEDLRLLEEAKKDRKGIKSIDELLREYRIES